LFQIIVTQDTRIRAHRYANAPTDLSYAGARVTNCAPGMHLTASGQSHTILSMDYARYSARLAGQIRTRGRAIVGVLLLGLLLAGCLEQEMSTRIPEGAAHNFLYFLARNERADASAYWAPGHLPPDADAQIAQAAAALQGYTVDMRKSDVVHESDGSLTVTLSGYAYPKGSPPPTGANEPLIRTRLIEIGPGWRVTQFELLCCSGS
jgi:hypothetical protein